MVLPKKFLWVCHLREGDIKDNHVHPALCLKHRSTIEPLEDDEGSKVLVKKAMVTGTIIVSVTDKVVLI
jgi:hypothetical protein